MSRQDLPFAKPVPLIVREWNKTVLIPRGSEEEQKISNPIKMKRKFIPMLIIAFSVALVSCNDDFETQPKSTSAVNASAVQVKIGASESPYLKNGEDDENPVPMYGITGTVTQNGSPVAAEVQLTTTPDDSLVDSTNTDSNGGFEFSQVPKGKYRVVIIIGGNVSSINEVNL